MSYIHDYLILGRKQLVLDPQLMRPMDRVAGMSVLKSAGVETVVKQADSSYLQTIKASFNVKPISPS